MKLKMMFCALVFALGGLVVAQTPETQDEESVRGAFLTTRPKEKPPQANAGAKPIRRRPRSNVTPASTVSASNSRNSNSSASATSTVKKPNTSGSSTATTKKVDPPGKITPHRIGLGLTLFTRDSNGMAVRVDPSREFHKGEAVRVLLETNGDGYLYIFNTTDNGPATMIYPSAELDEGGNYVQSHVPFEIPSSLSSDERLRWFRFDETAGTERLYFVFSREPLSGIPIEDDLLNYCRENKTKCPWRPSADVWTQVQKEMGAPLKTAKSGKYGTTQTTSEHDASTRGLGLSQEDPEPSLIMMATGTGSKSLVTTLELIHK